MFGRGRMAKHEAHCCRNPFRDCGVCEAKHTNVTGNAIQLMDDGLEALKKAVDRCPACVLAAHIMANKLNDKKVWDEDSMPYYDYKKAMEKWFAEKNAADRDSGYPFG